MSAAAAAAPAAAAAAPAEEAKALKMKYAPLGRSGLRVSELCLGAMTFGLRAGTTSLGLQNIGEEESLRVLDRFVEMGGNFIDTADGYTDTESEQLLGRWLAAKPAGFRQRVVIATKVFFPRSDDPNDRGLSRKHILENVDKSLQRLQTSYIDLYIVHCWDEGAPLEETLRALNDLVVAGKVRYLGCSNFCGWQLQKALMLQEQRGWARFIALQPQYSLLCRSPEWELFDVCQREGLGITPWSPLAGGWLTGRYKRDAAPEKGSRVEWYDKMNFEGLSSKAVASGQVWAVLDALARVAGELRASQAQVALRWVMQRAGVASTIIGVNRVAQLEENARACALALSPEQMRALAAASAPETPYPYSFINRMNGRQ